MHDLSDRVHTQQLTDARSARQKLRQSIFDSWQNKCAYCDVVLNPITASLDHIKPRHKGGKDRVNNLVACCTSCNQSKGSEGWIGWYRDQDFHQIEREGLIVDWLGNRH